MNDEWRTDTIAYPESNVLTYTGTLSKPGTFQLATDSAVALQYLWVDSIPASLILKEEKTKYEKNKLIIKDIAGSDDTKLLFQLTEPRQLPVIKMYPNASKEMRDSASKVFSTFYYNIIDSLFTVRPESQVIPHYIRFYERMLGTETTRLLYDRLNTSQQNSEQGQKIKEFLDRNFILSKGTLIENFNMKQPNGKKLSLHNIKGSYILLDFWASWCGPCRAENPHLIKLYEKFNKKGLQIIGISLDDDKKDWVKAIEKDKLPWLHVSELKGWENQLAEKYKISSVPFTILLDSNYKVVANQFSASQLDPLLSNLLK